MQTFLDSAHIWFLESFSQEAYGALVIRIVEAAPTGQQKMLELAGVELGPMDVVDKSQGSRRAEIRFDPAFAFFTFREEFDTIDPALVLDGRQSYIREVSASSVRDCAKVATGLFKHGHYETVREFHVWTAQQIFQVFSAEPPVVALLP